MQSVDHLISNLKIKDMKSKTWIIAAFVFLPFTSCQSQQAKKGEVNRDKIKPHEEVKVNKKYDDNGNLIAFDSVYTSYYSNIEGDTLFNDSIMGNFQMYFNHALNNNFSLDEMFTPDIGNQPDFFSSDFFEQRFLEQNQEMLNMMQKMDSLKNEFFKMHAQSISP